MPDWQDTGDGEIFAPILTCRQILTAVWQRAGEESKEQSILFEEWIQEVSNWAKLAEWKAGFKQKLLYGDNLWLPSADTQELGVLLGIAGLADELGCTATQIAKAFMGLPLSDWQQSSQSESGGGPLEVDQAEAADVSMVEMNQGKETQSPLAVDRTYQPLIEALSDWQAMFELALDEAAARLDHEYFPAEDLSASLSEMCELLRDVLARNSGLHKIQS